MIENKKSWEPEDDWFYESNVQSNIKSYLEKNGWDTQESPTQSRKKGPDILAKKNKSILVVEVKGFPSDKYVRGKNKGMKKKTSPFTQARHWLAEALFTLLLAKSKDPTIKIALGLPIQKTYQTKCNDLIWFLKNVDLIIYWVNEKGKVNEDGR